MTNKIWYIGSKILDIIKKKEFIPHEKHNKILDDFLNLGRQTTVYNELYLLVGWFVL